MLQVGDAQWLVTSVTQHVKHTISRGSGVCPHAGKFEK